MHNTYTWFVKNFAAWCFWQVIQLSAMETERTLTEREAANPKIVEAVQRYEQRCAVIAAGVGPLVVESAEVAFESPQLPE